MKVPRFEPMLATPWREPFTDPGWLFEVKWDGVRAILTTDGESLSLRSRRGNDITDVYPELSGFAPSRPCVLDGEIVAFGESGRPSFAALQQRMNLTGGARTAKAAATTPINFVVFDLLFDDEDLSDRSIETRLERMAALDLPAPMVRSEVMETEGEALFAAIAEQGLEGIVAKRRGSSYRSGVRSPDWRKIPNVRTVRAVVGGSPGERAAGPPPLGRCCWVSGRGHSSDGSGRSEPASMTMAWWLSERLWRR